MAVQPTVHQPKRADDAKRPKHKPKRHDRIGNERVEGLFGKVAGVIQGVALLAPGGKCAEEHQGRCVK